LDPFKKSPGFLDDFRAGRAEALERVYRAFARPLRNFVSRGFAFKSDGKQLYYQGMWAEHDLEDIVQETFRRAFGVKARAAYDGIRPYKNYLFTIARNAVITDLSVRRRQIPVGEALMRDAPSDDLSPLESWVLAQRSLLAEEPPVSSEERVENLEVYGLIASFVEALGRDEDAFFQLRFLGQCSQEITAKKLGWNRARVRKVEARLRRAFLAHIKDTGYLESRNDSRLVRRVADATAHHATFARARAIYRERRAELPNEFLNEAA
jgi:RNA polymerase sigma factor (sigma-70 family)